MANATLRRVVTEIAAPQDAILKHLEKKSGILKTALAQESSHGHFHKYKKVDALPTFSVYSAGGSLTDQTVNDDVYQLDLKNIGAVQSEPKDIAETFPGGVAAFFERQFPSFIEGFGQKASASIIYGTDSTFGDQSGFKGFHQIAREATRTDGLNSNSNVIKAGGASGSRTSIFAVKWDSSTCAILFDGQKVRNEGQFLEVTQINDGQPILEVTNTTTGAKKPVYQVLYSARMGLYSSSFYDVAAYTQIQDATNDKPTASNMDLLLDLVHADPMDTVLYMNRTARRLLYELKNGKIQTFTSDKNFDQRLEAWNGIPLIVDDNISGVETTVLD